MGSIKIAPSVLSADMANLKGELDKIAGADYVHFDVMDGHFTGNLTFGVDILKAVKRSTNVPVDAHLMVSNPDETVDWYADAGADMITVHYEASGSITRLSSQSRTCTARSRICSSAASRPAWCSTPPPPCAYSRASSTSSIWCCS
ncbi:ribulose-phosphate 3-epimerase [Collinsella aerofaciens]|uniref:ribulose-phosphate 3-epimerase n=1 Tax=Collinsella aerofaciens TaxID=74426 RepID=UPI003D3201DC